MPIPNYESIMLPLLKQVADGKIHSLQEVREKLADHFKLTSDELRLRFPSGTLVFNNRVAWAKTYLKQSGLIENLKRGHFCITKRGLEVLNSNPPGIDADYLNQFPEFRAFRQRNRKKQKEDIDIKHHEELTPEEAIETAYQTIKEELKRELLEQIKTCSPAFFERLVIDLLLKMGYGGSLADAGKAIGMSGDGGIDGIIKEDKLGLEIVYIQAKRWENTVSRPEIQKFAGALQGKRARKGIFITTSSFSDRAKEYARTIDTRIILIDGDLLTELMIDYNVGISTKTNYELKRIDSDYFIED